MPTDPVTEARATIAEKEKVIRTAEQTKHQRLELGHLIYELESLPADGRITITVHSPATGKERLFALPKEAAPGLLEFVHDEVTRLETPDAVV